MRKDRLNPRTKDKDTRKPFYILPRDRIEETFTPSRGPGSAAPRPQPKSTPQRKRNHRARKRAVARKGWAK